MISAQQALATGIQELLNSSTPINLTIVNSGAVNSNASLSVRVSLSRIAHAVLIIRITSRGKKNGENIFIAILHSYISMCKLFSVV